MDFWTLYWAFTSFVFGAVVGSFLNVCIWRLPRGASVILPASRCPNCDHRLRLWPDMVPILSQLWQRSRCRYCGAGFSWRYLWIELLTGALFTAIYFRYLGEPVSAIVGMLFVAALIVIFFIDLEHYVIPDAAVLVAVLAAVARDLYLISQGTRPLWQAVPGTPWSIPLPLSIFWGLVALWLLWQFAALATAALGREAMGAGDSLLLGAMGAYLIPWPLLVLAFFAAVFLGTLGGIAGMVIAARAEEAAGSAKTAETAGRAEMEPAAAGEPGPPSPACIEEEPGPEPELMPAEVPASAAGPGDGLERIPEQPEASRPGLALASPDDEVPQLPPASRWGRLVTVAGTWAAVAALWGGAALFAVQPIIGIVTGALGGIIAAVLLVVGTRTWVRADREWLPAMDEFFEEDPGPRFIPFGPYLVAGTLIAVFFGDQVVHWYRTVMGF